MKRHNSKFIAPFCILALALTPLTVTILPASADSSPKLKGGVLQEDRFHTDGPSLSRNEMKRGDTDPFGGGGQGAGDEMLKPPPGALDGSVFEGKPLRGNANDDEGPFGSKGMPQLEPDDAPSQGDARNDTPFQSSTTTPGVGDNSAQMKLLWDAWHKRVAETIYSRFNQSAQTFFKRSQPLSCQVSYMVARDGRVGQVRVLQPSSNPIYDTMLVTVIKSIQHNPVLEYPPNSQRQFVEKSGTFTWNYSGSGVGFRFLTGDQEKIQKGKGR